ncbi:MAG: SDR family oxidoreductase [Mycobacterium sp.]
MAPQSLSGRTVLVTGASRGIGRATAVEFARRGAQVFGTSREPTDDDERIAMRRLDVRSDESVRACVEHVLAQVGHLDVLVNNAGVMHEGLAEETTPQDAGALFDVNFFGVDRVIRAVLPTMRERRRGRILNVGSGAAWVGEPGEAFYAATKAALARYTEALRHEVRHLGVYVSLVEPGAFQTGVLDVPTPNRAVISDYDSVRERAHETLHRALRRGGDPRKVAELIVKIAASAAPRGRYGVGVDSVTLPLLKTLLPQRIFEFALRRGYHLPG